MAATTSVLIGAVLTSGIAVASPSGPTGTRTVQGSNATAAAATSRAASPISVRTLEAVTLRAEPTTGSAALGVLGKGVKLLAYEGAVRGNYKACGKSGNKWERVGKEGTGIKGWVVSSCLKYPWS
ncbi:SH3 domain-containing protein [Streptomyces sp. NPDC059008]|uniref:SH3 domain-containing protein n=1 Tax=Streptomyces sp. NPDC059008 TaxID=3346693 RepID=UPI0036C9F3A9